MMKKAGVIFDMDGLMFDTQRIYDRAFKEVLLLEHGLDFPEGMRLALMGRSGKDMYDIVNRYYPQLDAPEFVRKSFDLVAKLVETDLTARPGLDVLLPYLKEQGYRIGLASGSNRTIVDSNLAASGLRAYFIGTLSGDEVTAGKPDPECYLRAAALIGCDPQDCYVLEDSPNGVRAGVRAGCSVLMVPNVVEPDEEMHRISTGIYDSLADVKEAMEVGLL
ncbi:MAG: HAD family phosphatase [Lachnospiraceae bacterium]|nr:HAD family phosphatase [Lachnospiraceae bacterium]